MLYCQLFAVEVSTGKFQKKRIAQGPRRELMKGQENLFTMKSLNDIKKILASHKNELRKQYNVKQIGIFGSLVRGEQTKRSDLDILVEFERPIGLIKFLELEEQLSHFLDAKVDLVSKKALKPNIGKFILDEVVMI